MTDTPAPQARTYAGGCQCGAVAFEVETALQPLIECNCSRCGKLGSILTFVAPDQFRLIQGEGESTEFRFNTHAIGHRFCATCGIESYARGRTAKGEEMVAINVRCLEGVDAWALETRHYHGASR